MISPHLDDAILSLGGSVARWSQSGRVVVATVYTTGPPLAQVSPSMQVFADYRTRRREDAAACRLVGAHPCWLHQTERAFRSPHLRRTQVFTTPTTRAGFAGLGAVTAALTPLFSPAPHRIALPLGIGNHVDHVEALIAATDLVLAHGLFDRVVFYEDFYALSGVMRRAHWVATSRRWSPWQGPLRRARRLSALLAAVARARRGPPVERLLAQWWRDADWTAEPVALSAGDLASKLAAVECYRSQTRAFGGFAGIEAALRAYHAWWGNAEPVWRATT